MAKRKHKNHPGHHAALDGHHGRRSDGPHYGKTGDGHVRAGHAGTEPGGVSPRKRMAGAGGDGGSFGTIPFDHAVNHHGEHQDHVEHTGMAPTMEDHERAAGMPIHHTRGHHPAQPAPDHGPHHVGHPHPENPHGDHHRRHPLA